MWAMCICRALARRMSSEILPEAVIGQSARLKGCQEDNRKQIQHAGAGTSERSTTCLRGSSGSDERLHAASQALMRRGIAGWLTAGRVRLPVPVAIAGPTAEGLGD